MKVRSISLVEALEIIQSRRSQADPNPGFRLQLELYESAGCNVDVRNQRIRRYLMSHSSILKGDPIDDVLLSYYPSPFHSPSNSYTGSLNNGMQGPANLKFSTLDEADNAEDSRSSRATSQVGSSASVSPTMSRQGSRAATAAAAANKGAQRRRSSSKADGTSTLNLSISPPMPPNANELFDNVDGSQEQDEDPSKRLIKEKFSSVKEDHEVLITISTGNLPGGVKLLKGNQGKANGDVRLPKPHFRGLKLRCKMCRTELAARDHVVEHEAGRGKDAFDVRKREKDIDAKNKDGRIVRELGIEERFGAQTRIQQPSSPPAEKEESTSTTEELNKGDEKQQMLSNGNSIQTAASLSAQLPPHLAALRQGRAGQTTSSVSPNRSAASPPQQRRMLHSSECSSYFVEPLAWMSALKLGEVAGRLDCPNARCGAKLGSWDWAGMQCAWYVSISASRCRRYCSHRKFLPAALGSHLLLHFTNLKSMKFRQSIHRLYSYIKHLCFDQMSIHTHMIFHLAQVLANFHL
jgi:dual specificity phosphatase 12